MFVICNKALMKYILTDYECLWGKLINSTGFYYHDLNQDSFPVPTDIM